MDDRIIKVKQVLQNNKKVMENYFFMTTLQVLNSFFYLIIYPYLINTLGKESYGLYVFVYSIITYFIAIVNFGFDMPALKSTAECRADVEKRSDVYSVVFMAKVGLECIISVIFFVLLWSIPALKNNMVLCLICFGNTMVNILFPVWYFQALQRMKVVTGIQLLFKLLSLPFMFCMIEHPDDVNVYAVIVLLSNLLGAGVAFMLIRYKDGVRLRRVPFPALRGCYKEAFPFFLSNGMNVIKQQSANIVIGSFFGMGEVALYDLANKIFTIPTILTASINGAIFPKLILNLKKESIKKVLRLETLLGIGIILFLIVFGKYVIVLLGGENMLGAYPILIILSCNVLTPLLVGCYCYFLFLPNGLSHVITKNQTVALFAFILAIVIGLLITRNILVLPSAMLFSGLSELVYSNVVIKKRKLL